jgi:hypothetical protein
MGYISAGIATVTSWTVRFPAEARNVSVLHSVHIGSEAHPVSYPLATGALSSGLKPPGREADHSPPSSVEVKNGEAIPPLSHTSSWSDA